MKNLPLYIALYLCFMSFNVFALEVYFPYSEPPDALKCPNSVTTANKPNKSSPPKKEPINELPSIEEVKALFAESHNNMVLETEQIQTTAPLDTWKRIGIWGDSHAAANFFSEALIKGMELDKQGILPGFISPFVGSPSVRLPLRKVCKSNGWKMEHAYINRNTEAKWSRALTRLRSQTPNAYLWIDFRSAQLANTFQTLHVRIAQDKPLLQNAHALIRLSVNGAAAQVIDIDAATDSFLSVASESPIATFQLEMIEGNIGIEGFVPYYNTNPRYILDTFGIPGATAKGLQFMAGTQEDNEDPWPLYDLVIAEFGTNEGNNLNFNQDAYEADLRKSVGALRQKYPNADCVLIGPTDRGIFVPRSRLVSKKVCTLSLEKSHKKGKNKHKKKQVCKIVAPPKIDMLPYARIHEAISTTQARIATEFSCQAWSWQEAMGGKGGIYRWLYRKPALAQRDLIHLTAEGYKYSANLFLNKLWQISDEKSQAKTENLSKMAE